MKNTFTKTNTTTENTTKTVESLVNLNNYFVDKSPVAMKKAFIASPENVTAYLGRLYGSELSERQIAKLLRETQKSGKGTPKLVPLELREKRYGAETWFLLTNGDAFCVSEEKTDILKSIFSEYWEQRRTLRYVRNGVAVLARKAAEYADKKESAEKKSGMLGLPSYILEIFGPEWGEELQNMKVRFADDDRRRVELDLTSFFDFEAVPWVHRRRAFELVKNSAFTSNRAKRHFCRVIKKADPAVSWNISKWLWHEKCQCH